MKSPDTRDLAPERLEKVRRILAGQRVVSVSHLQRELGISAATARRDLLQLAALGEVRRVHGGAMRIGSRLEEPLFDNKESVAADEKQRIARAAFALIAPNACVYLDGGSTVLALARLLRDQAGLSVVTNSLRVAMELASEGPRLILVGGELRRLSQTFVGPITRHTIDPLHFDIAFMGTIGVTREAGLTTTDHQEAFTKSLVIAHAQQVVLLADSAKAGRVSFARFGAASDVHCLITDSGINARTAREIRRSGVKIVTV